MEWIKYVAGKNRNEMGREGKEWKRNRVMVWKWKVIGIK